MKLIIDGIEIEIIKKDIKNLHLSVMPPNGRVRVSVPHGTSDESIEFFVRSKKAWIKSRRKMFDEQLRQSKRKYVSGETLFLWGEQFFLQVDYSNKGNCLTFDGNKAILVVRKESTAVQRANFVDEELRKILKQEIAKKLVHWEKKTGLTCAKWKTRIMKTHWGSFSDKTNTITFNLQLVKKPHKCLDYIIVHELGHTKHRTHGKQFIAHMDKHLPLWRETKTLLNGLTLDHID